MSMTDPALQMLAYELAAIFGVLAMYLAYKQFKKSKSVNTQASASVKKIKQLKNRRVDNLTSVLSQKYGLVDEALTQKAEAIQKQEQLIHKSQVALFVEQEGKTLKNAPQQIEKLVDMCLELLPVGQDSIKPEKAEVETEDDDIRASLALATQKIDLLLDDVKQIRSGLSLEKDQEVESELDTSENDEIEEQSDSLIEVDAIDEEAQDEIEEEAVEEFGDIDIVAGSDDEGEVDGQEDKSEEMISADDIDSLLSELESEQLVNDGIDLAESDDEAVEEIVSVFAGYKDNESDETVTQDGLEETFEDNASSQLEEAEIIEQPDNSTDIKSASAEQEVTPSDEKDEELVGEEQQLADMMADIAQDLESASDLLDKSEKGMVQENKQDDLAKIPDDEASSVAMTAEEIEALTENELAESNSSDVIDEQKVAELREQVRQKTQQIQQENS